MAKKKPEDYDITKLPQWAQDKIANLTRQCDTLQEALNADREGRKDSPIQITDNIHHTSRGVDAQFEQIHVAIGRRKRKTGEPRYYVALNRLDDGRLEVMGSDTLLFKPVSSNVFIVDIADRLEQNEDAPERDLGQRLMKELVAKGLDWQDGMNMVNDCDPAAVKATRNKYRGNYR